MSTTLTWRMRQMRDKTWLDTLKKSVTTPQIGGVQFPGFPSDEMQSEFVGSANHATLDEAFKFYVLMKQRARRLHHPISRKTCFLDFGCGWGRYLRFFWKDVHERNLFGCDVNARIVETCRALHVTGRIDLIQPQGRLPYSDGHFSAMMAYSVFTHLPQPIHLHWIKELARVCPLRLCLLPHARAAAVPGSHRRDHRRGYDAPVV